MTVKQFDEELANKNYEAIKDFFGDLSLDKLTSFLDALPKEDVVKVFHCLPPKHVANVFLHFSKELQQYFVDNFSVNNFKKIAEILLDDEEFEQKIDKDIYNDIILHARVNTRREKLVEIIDGIENKAFNTIKPILSEMEPVDIAEILNEIDENKLRIIFRLLPKDLASDTFVEMDLDAQKVLVEAFTDKELGNIINDLFTDDVTDLVEEMPSNVVRRILRVASNDTRASVNKMLGFPKDSAGSIMTPECITLRPWMNVEDALKKIRKQALDKETIYMCYVTDDKKKLLGTVTVKDILIHDLTDKIESFMDENYICVHTLTDKEEVSKLLSKYDLLAIPVVDSENRINGIVTVDDAIDVIKEEAVEDMSIMSAVTPTDKPYLKTSVFEIFKSRVPWLLLLMVSATFTGLIINKYETTLNAISTLLFACIPMLMDSGGNAGGQASVTIIRSLALDELSLKDVFKVVWKEFRVSLILALSLAVACFAKLQLIDRLIFGYDYTFAISLVVSVSLFVTICIAKLVGACLPLLAKKCKLDPAVVASPFITTIVDALSLIVYCQFAIMLL